MNKARPTQAERNATQLAKNLEEIRHDFCKGRHGVAVFWEAVELYRARKHVRLCVVMVGNGYEITAMPHTSNEVLKVKTYANPHHAAAALVRAALS